MDFIFGILGLTGGLLCTVADIFLDLKGRGNVKLGKYKFIESNWANMSLWRFKASIILASISIPLYYLGIIAMKNQLARTSELSAQIFGIVTMVGMTGSVFIHAILCYIPIIYKTLDKKIDFESIEGLINRIWDAISIPFIAFYLCIVAARWQVAH
jgi:hypothetical protein